MDCFMCRPWLPGPEELQELMYGSDAPELCKPCETVVKRRTGIGRNLGTVRTMLPHGFRLEDLEAAQDFYKFTAYLVRLDRTMPASS